MRTLLNAVLAVLFTTLASAASLLPAPETPKKPVTDEYQKILVEDPFRWLEESKSPVVKTWSDAQNLRTRQYLEAVPHRSEIHARIDHLIRANSIAYHLEVKRGGLLFARKATQRNSRRP